MKNASHHICEVGSDQRLVTSIISGKNEFQRGNNKLERWKTEDKALNKLKQKNRPHREMVSKQKKILKQKVLQTKMPFKNAIKKC